LKNIFNKEGKKIMRVKLERIKQQKFWLKDEIES